MEPPRLPLAARLKPPFLRPELLERAAPLKVKLSDNGLKAGLGRSKVGAPGWVGDGVSDPWWWETTRSEGPREMEGGIGWILGKGLGPRALGRSFQLSLAPGLYPLHR